MNLIKKLIATIALTGALAGQSGGASAQTHASADMPLADVHFHLMLFMTPEELQARARRHNIRWIVSAGAIGSRSAGEPWNRDLAVHRIFGDAYVPGAGGAEVYRAERDQGVQFFNATDNDRRDEVLMQIDANLRSRKSSIIETFPNAENSSVDPLRRRRVATDGIFFQELMRLSAAVKTPLPMHMEWHSESVSQLEKLLSQHPNGTVVLSHCGKTTVAEDIRGLFKRHSNVMCDLGFRSIPQAQAESQLDPRRLIYWPAGFMRSADTKADWLRLIEEFPDRFMVAIDDVHTWDQYDDVVSATRSGLLAKLTPTTAEMVAWRNAVKLYRLSPP
jgi:predicted TIM-barrel fold metal-dependent hydrolase